MDEQRRPRLTRTSSFSSRSQSLEAIRAFAGEDISRAKYYPQDRDFLLEFEPTVEHYELYAAPESEQA
jgi:hypothetical protein